MKTRRRADRNHVDSAGFDGFLPVRERLRSHFPGECVAPLLNGVENRHHTGIRPGMPRIRVLGAHVARANNANL